MAKKDPTDLTVEEKLKALYQLQVTLSGIDENRELRGELPLEVQDLEDDIAGLTTRIENIQREIEQFDHAVYQKQNEIADAQASLERYHAQLDTVSNNREYDTLSKEIEFQELEIELCNKKIREGMAKMREREFDLHKAEEKRAELEDILEETHEEEERLKEKALELEKKIEPRLLASFKRIRKGARNGLGIVYVQRDACGGCFNKIPPQRQLDIKMHKKIIPCEYCGRILIDPELAGVKIETPNTDEKPKRKRISRRKKAEDAE